MRVRMSVSVSVRVLGFGDGFGFGFGVGERRGVNHREVGARIRGASGTKGAGHRARALTAEKPNSWST